MALTGTVLCAKAGPMTQDTPTGSTVIQALAPCIPTAGATSTGPGTVSGQTVRCAAVGSGTHPTEDGFTAAQVTATCTPMAGTA